MEKFRYKQEQEILQNLLRNTRTNTGLLQQEVADQLKKPQSFVSKYESGERRLDILELREVCRILGISLVDFTKRLEKGLAKKKKR